MKIQIGTNNSKIVTDNPDLLKTLCNLYSFKVPGAEYSAAYKRHSWDGKKYYITRGGAFKTGLLTRILVDLKKIDCVPELDWGSPTSTEQVTAETVKNFTYYPYQEQLINSALNDRRGIIKSPTGSGKTLIMAGIIKTLAPKIEKMVILFNAKQLLTQTYEFLTKACEIEDVGLCFGEGFIQGNIMLCTVQSIEKILDTHLDSSELLMVDEVHEFANGKTTLAAINSFPAATYRIGLTATPPSNDIPKYNLEGAFGPVWEETSASGLVEAGKLTKPVIQLIPMSYEEGSDEDKSYLEIYEEFIVTNEDRNNKIKLIVDNVKDKKKKARILILTKDLAHATLLEELLDNSYKLWGEDDITTRYKTINKFLSSSETSILIGTKILQTGINIEEITHLINARGLKSEIATLQALGRALRKHPDKEQVYIYDFMDKVKYLRAHANKRKEHYNKEGHEIKIL